MKEPRCYEYGTHYVRCTDEELDQLMSKYSLNITYNESDLPELKMTLAAADAFSAISAIREDVRAIVKHHDLTDEQYKVAEGIYATILTHCQDLQETSGVEF